MMGRERISTQFQVDCLYFYFRCEGGTHEEAMEIVRLAMPSPTRSRLIHMKKRLRNLEIKPSPYKYQPYAVSPGFLAWVNRPT